MGSFKRTVTVTYTARAWTHDGKEIVGRPKFCEVAAALDVDRLKAMDLIDAHIHLGASK